MLSINIHSFKLNSINIEAQSVVLPGLNGDIGVNFDNTGRVLCYLLKEGVIYFINNGQSFEKIFIFGGMFISDNNNLIITTEYDFIDIKSVKIETLIARVKFAESKLNTFSNKALKLIYEDILRKEKILLDLHKTRSNY